MPRSQRQSAKQSFGSRKLPFQQQQLDAEVNKKADAERYKVEQEAAAMLAKRQREAEARKYELEKEAEAMRTKQMPQDIRRSRKPPESVPAVRQKRLQSSKGRCGSGRYGEKSRSLCEVQ